MTAPPETTLTCREQLGGGRHAAVHLCALQRRLEQEAEDDERQLQRTAELLNPPAAARRQERRRRLASSSSAHLLVCVSSGEVRYKFNVTHCSTKS